MRKQADKDILSSMRIGCIGTGSWGFCLAHLLAKKGYEVTSWSSKSDLVDTLKKTGVHPLYPSIKSTAKQHFTCSLEEAVDSKDLLLESVTTAGIRPVFSQVAKLTTLKCPLVITSKGVELKTGLLLPELLVELFGDEAKKWIGILSGPSFAKEIIQGLPTSVVASAFDPHVMHTIADTFTTGTLRVYPNSDIRGVALVGALKNPIAIACGMADGLGVGASAKAALMTRGLHEIRKLGVAMNCRSETFNGLAGLGDLCMTASSPLSRNFRFGQLIAKGKSFAEAEKEIGMVVEGAYSSEAALRLSEQYQIPIPITEGVFHIIHGRIKPEDALGLIMKRPVKEEHL